MGYHAEKERTKKIVCFHECARVKQCMFPFIMSIMRFQPNRKSKLKIYRSREKKTHRNSLNWERDRDYRLKQQIQFNFHIINISLTYINKNEAERLKKRSRHPTSIESGWTVKYHEKKTKGNRWMELLLFFSYSCAMINATFQSKQLAIVTNKKNTNIRL